MSTHAAELLAGMLKKNQARNAELEKELQAAQARIAELEKANRGSAGTRGIGAGAKTGTRTDGMGGIGPGMSAAPAGPTIAINPPYINTQGITTMAGILPSISRSLEVVSRITQDIPNWRFINSVVIPLAQKCPAYPLTYNGFYCSMRIISNLSSRSQMLFSDAGHTLQDAYCGVRIGLCTGELTDHNTRTEVTMFCLEVEFNGHPIDLSKDYDVDGGGWPRIIYIPDLDSLAKKIEEFKIYITQQATPDFVRECYNMLPADGVLRDFHAQFGDNVQIIGPIVM